MQQRKKKLREGEDCWQCKKVQWGELFEVPSMRRSGDVASPRDKSENHHGMSENNNIEQPHLSNIDIQSIDECFPHYTIHPGRIFLRQAIEFCFE